MVTTMPDMVRRRAERPNASYYDHLRAIAVFTGRDNAFAAEQRQKAVVDPISGPYSGDTGYWRLYELFMDTAVLPRIGGAEVPFSSPSAVQTAPATAAWCAFGMPIPVTSAAFTSVTLDPLKAGSMTVATESLLRASGDRADAALRRIIVNAAVSATNTKLLSDDAAVTNTSPAGLRNGATVIVAGQGQFVETFEQVYQLIDGMRNPTIVASLPLGIHIRAGLGDAGSLLPLVIAPEAGAFVYAVDENAVAFALGSIDVAASDETTLHMDDAPQSPNNMTSMFQTDGRALRVVVHANWEVARADGVRVLDYTSQVSP